MPSQKPTPQHRYRLYDLAEDFRLGLIDIMSEGFSVHHLDYVLDPLASDALSGDPPPAGEERFHLSWTPLNGYVLSDELDHALLEKFPVRAILEKTDTVTDAWYRIASYILITILSGQIHSE